MSKFYVLLLCVLCSCANSQNFYAKDGTVIHAEPYGWANSGARKDDRVVYEVSFGTVVLSLIGIETVLIPVWLTGWQLFEPVRLKDGQ